MRKVSSLAVAAALVCCSALLGCSKRPGGKHTVQPPIEPSAAASPVPPDGKRDAEGDIKKGVFSFYEVGQPMAHDSQWKAILSSRYGIRLITLGSTPRAAKRADAQDYNEAIRPFGEEKYGRTFMDETEAEAKRQRQEARSQ